MIQILNIFKEKPIFATLELAAFFYLLYSVLKFGIDAVTGGGKKYEYLLISFIGILLPLPLYFFSLSKVLYVYGIIALVGFVIPFVVLPTIGLGWQYIFGPWLQHIKDQKEYELSKDPKEFEISPDNISSYYDGEITIKGQNLGRDCKVTFEPSYNTNTSYVYEFKDIVWKNDNEFAVKFPAEPNDLADQSSGNIFYHLNGKKFNCGYFSYYKRKPIVESISPLFGSMDDKMIDIGTGIEGRKFANWEIAEGDKLVIKGKFDDDTVVIFATKYGLQLNDQLGRIGYNFFLPVEGGAILAIVADSVLINDNEIQVTIPSLESLKQYKNPWSEIESIIDIRRTRVKVFNGKESNGSGGPSSMIFEFQYKQ